MQMLVYYQLPSLILRVHYPGVPETPNALKHFI